MNRLADARSPYLRAHAANPVDWWPWCDEAFAEARRRDCPVFLSIGYAACHWCHVMEAETFSDPVIGRLLSDGFVSIKVDREERPDVDALYMEALVSMTGEGGWPASLWLTPDGRPFHAGTYFPPHYRYGTPAFGDVLMRLQQSWETGRRSVEELAERTRTALVEAHGSPRAADAPDRSVVAAGARQLLESYDRENGGWGYGPRFPQPPRIELLLQWAALEGDANALSTALHLLDAIDRGGLHDHVGGGFHRYTVDADWEVPHFEKMLSDNAQLASVFLHAWSLTGEGRLATLACETLEYLLDRLGHADGGFSSSEDADDPVGEGAFYTWTPAQLQQALGPVGAVAVGTAYGVTRHGNHEGGGSILFRKGDPSLLSAFRSKLRAARSRRPAPAVDDKRVVAWNAMAASAFALAGRLLGEARYLDTAVATVESCLAVVAGDGACPRTLEPGSPPGVLDDSACLVEALLDLYEATGQRRWLDEARRVAVAMLSAFLDTDSGALWHSVADSTLPLRRVQWGDGAEPSGAGVAARVLVRLVALGSPGIDEGVVRRLLGAASQTLASEPALCPTLLRALQVETGPPRTLVVTGPEPALLAVATARWVPDLLVAPVDRADPGPYTLFAGKTRSPPAAWLCEGSACRLPTRDPDQLADWLGGMLST